MTFLQGLPLEHYKCIAADPAWKFYNWSKHPWWERSDKNTSRAVERHYETMTLDEIKALPVQHLASPDCMLFLWVTNPMLPEGLEVLKAWGFEFKTVAFTWAKTSRTTQGSWAPKWHIGMGYYTRANTEMCLLGTRGNPQRTDKGVRQLIVSPLREHSRKPDEFHESVERLCEGPRLELFARQSRPGWETRGLESTKFDTPQKAVSSHREARVAPIREAATTLPGPDAHSLLAKLKAGAGKVGGIPTITAKAVEG
jgi:N6-adenosine-specific RNA methylase IME4